MLYEEHSEWEFSCNYQERLHYLLLVLSPLQHEMNKCISKLRLEKNLHKGAKM
jgi:hypothetical protein